MDILEILSNLGFDWRVALANLANFLIIFWLLKHFALKPIEKMLNERQSKINKGIEDAKKASTELQMAKQTSEKVILEARQEANRIIASTRQETEKITAESKFLQEEQAKQIAVKAEKLILQKKEKMMQDVKSQIAELVITATKKFIKEDLTKEKQKEIIKRMSK